MKKVLIIIGIGLLILAAEIAVAFFAVKRLINKQQQTTQTENTELTPNHFVADFTEISQIVKANYSHWETKRINPDTLFRIYSEQVQAAHTLDEYKNLLLAYFSELRNGHSNVYFSPYYYIDCEAKLIEDRVFIDRVGSSAAEAGIKEKDEILMVDSLPVRKWLGNQMKFISASTFESRFNDAVARIFFDYTGSTRTLLLKTSKGEKEIALTLTKNYDNVTGYAVNDSTGYIYIHSMMGNVVDEFKTEFEKLRTKPALIVDIRYNGGGNSGNSEKIVQYLIRKRQIACVSRMPLTPASNHYEGTLIVLIGVDTYSAAESFALDLKESGDAILIGSATGGDTGNRPMDFSTSYGTSFRIPTLKPAQISRKGFPMEGRGIEPDFTVEQTVNDYLKDVDTVLEYAIHKIAPNNIVN